MELKTKDVNDCSVSSDPKIKSLKELVKTSHDSFKCSPSKSIAPNTPRNSSLSLKQNPRNDTCFTWQNWWNLVELTLTTCRLLGKTTKSRTAECFLNQNNPERRTETLTHSIRRDLKIQAVVLIIRQIDLCLSSRDTKPRRASRQTL